MSTKSSSRVKLRDKLRREPWVSNSRVLNGNTASKKSGNFGRNPNFDTDETKLLIQLWGDPKVQRTLITTHKKHAVICQLATKMQEYGYYRSPEEITTRIKNLKCFYNRLKKDMESEFTLCVDPTWKHFAEMDAIMTRPIFSVRPNEVPAPSLKYQLEQAREEREERRKQVLREGGTLSDDANGLDDILALKKINSGTNIEVDDGIIPDVEVDIDISDETFAAAMAHAAKAAKKRKLSKTSVGSLDEDGDSELEGYDSLVAESEQQQSIKNENESNESESDDQTKILYEAEDSLTTSKQKVDTKEISKTKQALKEEPIDVDSDSSNMETISSSNLKEFISKSNITVNTSGMVLPSTKGSCSVANVTYTTAASTTQGKISLVPTNFLMQPKVTTRPQQIHLLQNMVNSGQMQQRILLSGQPNQTSGMKVILVNAEQNPSNQICASSVLPQQISGSNCLSNNIGNVLPLNNVTALHQLQKQINHQKEQTLKQQIQKEQQKKENTLQKKAEYVCQKKKQQGYGKCKREEIMSKKDFSGLRILLRQLLKTQTENNDIQRRRLAIERERLDFEKIMAEKLPPYLSQQHQQQITQQMRLNPPKLVFTTSVPDPTASVSTPKVVKPVEICTQINNFQLLTPKFDKDE